MAGARGLGLFAGDFLARNAERICTTIGVGLQVGFQVWMERSDYLASSPPASPSKREPLIRLEEPIKMHPSESFKI